MIFKAIATSLLILTGLFARAQKYDIAGTWTQCVGVDSLETMKCPTGFTTYFLNTDGSFTLKDSALCYPRHFATTGRWVFKDSGLTLHYNDYRSEGCYYHQDPVRYSTIVWASKDLFYFVSIGTVDWQGQRIYSVFRRLK